MFKLALLVGLYESKKNSSHFSIHFVFLLKIGSLGNHVDNGDENVTYLHIQQRKTVALHALHERFVHFAAVSPFHDEKCFVVFCVSTWRESFSFSFPSPGRSYQFNSRIVSKQFGSQTSGNNRGMIAETSSYIFRWLSLCHRHRPNNLCLGDLSPENLFSRATDLLS